MQNSNQPDQNRTGQKQDPKKESAWKSDSPEDTTGKQPNRPNQSPKNKKQNDDQDPMGSGKRQDDN